MAPIALVSAVLIADTLDRRRFNAAYLEIGDVLISPIVLVSAVLIADTISI